MSNPQAYRPIECSLHDHLEAVATRGRTVRFTFRSSEGTLEDGEDRLVDVFARDGEEFVKTASGTLIRLDRLESVDGVAFGR